MLTTPRPYRCAHRRKAMKGLGTDEKALIEVLVEVHPDDMPALIQTYTTKIDRDLKKDIDGEIGGHFRDVARLMLLSNAELDATLVHKVGACLLLLCSFSLCDLISLLHVVYPL